MQNNKSSIPILDLSWADDPSKRAELLAQLHAALFDVGFLYIKYHGVPQSTISNLTDILPALFDLPEAERASLSKSNSPHFLGYSGFAEETTAGQHDLREQFDFATELPVVYRPPEPTTNGHINGETNRPVSERDFSKLYWRLRGPNQWPAESSLPGFRSAFLAYHNALQELSYRFVHLIEEAFGIPVGTFDHFFGRQTPAAPQDGLNGVSGSNHDSQAPTQRTFLPPQHRIKLLKYPPSSRENASTQGVGPHKDSSGWLTFLLQVGNHPGLEVLAPDDKTWLPVTPIPGTFVVNFGNAMEAATEGAVKATVHRVIAPAAVEDGGEARYSIPFFQGLPLDLGAREVKSWIPETVRALRRGSLGGQQGERQGVSGFLDERWDSLGESQLRKWVRSHQDVALKWYGKEVVEYYTAS